MSRGFHVRRFVEYHTIMYHVLSLLTFHSLLTLN